MNLAQEAMSNKFFRLFEVTSSESQLNTLLVYVEFVWMFCGQSSCSEWKLTEALVLSLGLWK